MILSVLVLILAVLLFGSSSVLGIAGAALGLLAAMVGLILFVNDVGWTKFSLFLVMFVAILAGAAALPILKDITERRAFRFDAERKRIAAERETAPQNSAERKQPPPVRRL